MNPGFISGMIISIIYRLVTVFAGAMIAAHPARIRKNTWWFHGIFWFLLLGVGIFRCWNMSLRKFGVTELLICAGLVWIVAGVFFNGNFWQLSAQNFLYWVNLLIMEYCMVCIASYYAGERVAAYNRNFYQRVEPWSIQHMAMELFLSAALILLMVLTRKRGLVPCKKNRTYGAVFLGILGEGIFFARVVYSEFYRYIIPDKIYVLSLEILLAVILVLVFASVLLGFYYEARMKEMQVEMNYRMLSGQYAALGEMYQEKRRQFHDVRQHYIILEGYLKAGKISEAEKYVDELMEATRYNTVKSYTGISAIDFILNDKETLAWKQGIAMELSLDVAFAPVKDMDLCIILGNLIDNAIEAAAVLEKDRRWISVSIKTKGNIFILEIKNPCANHRKKSNGRYETLKKDKASHGIGLENVGMVVDRYDGLLEIRDEGTQFYVSVTLFSKEDGIESDSGGHWDEA